MIGQIGVTFMPTNMRARSKSRRGPLLRKIYFFKIAHPEQILTQLPGDVARIANLPWTEQGRYLSDSEGDRFGLWVNSVDYPIKLRFGKTRMSELPTKELGGRLSSIELEENAGLADLVHVIIYRDGWVAAEFNGDGPRVKRLGEYLFAKRQSLTERPEFLPLYRRDILKIVENVTAVRLLELSGKPDAGELIAQADVTLGGAYKQLKLSGANKLIHLMLTAEDQPDSRLRAICRALAVLVHSKPGFVKDEITKLKIEGFDSNGTKQLVNLLDEFLISTKYIAREEGKAKALSTDDAFRKIDEAFNENVADFETAIVGKFFE